jgi:hypothetical protein
MFAPGVNFNRPAERWARLHGCPMVGNGDVHRLQQLGSTYSMVDSAPEPDAICDAIRAGRLLVKARPLSWPTAISLASQLLVWESLRELVTPESQRPTPEPKEAQPRNEGLGAAMRVRIRSLIGSWKLGVGS